MSDPVAAGAVDFPEWIRPHWPAMARLAARLAGRAEWEDVLQDALALAWRRRDQFDESRGSARTWLLTLTADQARKSLRALRPSVGFEPDETAAVIASGPDVDLERALATLTDRQRLAVELYYYLGLPVADVGQVMACSVGTVKSTLSDARARLRAQLGESFDD